MNLDGSLHPAFASLGNRFVREVDANAGGAGLCVYFRGRPVVDIWGGSRDGEGRPWQRDTLSPVFSATKGVASTLVHIAVDRGQLEYDAPVARYWPKFGRSGKSRITVRQVLCHQSGLYAIRRMVDDASRMRDWDFMVRAIEDAEPVHEPGQRTGYHGLTYGFIVGELLQRVTNTPFPVLVREEIARPLGLEGFYCGAPPEAIARAAELIWPTGGPLGSGAVGGFTRTIAGAFSTALEYVQPFVDFVGGQVALNGLRDALVPAGMEDFEFDSAETLAVPIPSANGIFDARSLARMYAALAEGGSLDGVRLISSETLREATEVQHTTGNHEVLPIDLGWRLGYHAAFTTYGKIPGAFGHFGFGGSGAWADPTRHLSMAFVANSGLTTPFGEIRIARLGAALLDGYDRLTAETGETSTDSPEMSPLSDFA